jgi:hypothetical protein
MNKFFVDSKYYESNTIYLIDINFEIFIKYLTRMFLLLKKVNLTWSKLN